MTAAMISVSEASLFPSRPQSYPRTMTTKHPRMLFGGLTLLGSLAFGQESATPLLPAPAAEETLVLTMSEAVVRALDANIEVSIERLKPQIAEQRRRQAVGVLDPHLDFPALSESLERPQ